MSWMTNSQALVKFSGTWSFFVDLETGVKKLVIFPIVTGTSENQQNKRKRPDKTSAKKKVMRRKRASYFFELETGVAVPANQFALSHK